MTYADIIARLTAATGPDRDVDYDIAAALGLYEAKASYGPHLRKRWHGPSFTASVDATLALIERVLPGCWYLFGKGKVQAGEPLFGGQILFGSDEVLGEGEHDSNLPLAILIAMFRAIDAKGAPHHG